MNVVDNVVEDRVREEGELSRNVGDESGKGAEAVERGLAGVAGERRILAGAEVGV